jgi:putative transposase
MLRPSTDNPAMGKHRKLLERFEVENQTRFLTFSCYKRLKLFQNDRIKDFFAQRLQAAHEAQRFRLSAWVIMPEHVHLLVVPNLPEFPVPKMLSAIKRPFAEAVLKRWRELNAPILAKLTDKSGGLHFWQTGGGHDLNVYTHEKHLQKLRYVHENPVVRGLVSTGEDWAWSSARWYTGDRSGPVKVDT